MKQITLLSILFVFIVSCKNEPKQSLQNQKTSQTEKMKPSDDRAVKILDSTITEAGGKDYETASIRFSLGDTLYRSKRNCGKFQLHRKFINQKGDTVHDRLRNIGFQRILSGETVNLSGNAKRNLRKQLYSVHYFTQLPFEISGPIVHKYYLGTTKIDKEGYHKIKVLYKRPLPGRPQKLFVWVNKSSGTLDFLAYSVETNGGKIRFRKAINPRIIGGIRFVDYKIYMPKSKKVGFKTMAKAYKEGKLKLVSTVSPKNIQVKVSSATCD